MARQKTDIAAKARESLIVMTEWLEDMKDCGIPDRDRLKIWEYCVAHRKSLGECEAPELETGEARMMLHCIRKVLDSNLQAYIDTLQKQSKGGEGKDPDRETEAEAEATETAETDAKAKRATKAAGMSDDQLVACYQRHCERLGIQPHEDFCEKYIAKGWPRSEASVKRWAEHDASYDKAHTPRNNANNYNYDPRRSTSNFAPSETDWNDMASQVMAAQEAQEAAKTQLPSAG